VKVAELLTQSVPPQDVFLAEHSSPALLIEPREGTKSVLIETPSQGSLEATLASAKLLATTNNPNVGPHAGVLLDPETEIAWLSKTERNPFQGLITIGRARNNDIVLSVRSVSKVHALFMQQDGEWFIEDNGSSNRTYLNGRLLEAKTRERLRDGDMLGLGPDACARFLEGPTLWDYLQLANEQAGDSSG
jgi:FHA domain